MLKFLFTNLKDAPVVGGMITAAYIGSLINDLVGKSKDQNVKEEDKNKTGKELDDALGDQANDMFEEHIGPTIKEYNVPNEVVKPLREKAIEQIVANLRKKVIQ